jgi:hypothetical protein
MNMSTSTMNDTQETFDAVLMDSDTALFPQRVVAPASRSRRNRPATTIVWHTFIDESKVRNLPRDFSQAPCGVNNLDVEPPKRVPPVGAPATLCSTCFPGTTEQNIVRQQIETIYAKVRELRSAR